MIKKIILAALVALPMFASAQKFGVVNTNDVMQALPDVKEVSDKVDAASKTYESEFQKLQEQMNKEYEEFQKLDPSTPDAIKQRRQQELQDLYQKLEQFRATATQDLQRQHEQLMAPIVQKVTDAITKVGQEQNLTFVFEQGQAIYVGTDVLNITADVKKVLGI